MKLGEVHLNQEFYTASALFGDQRYPKKSYMGMFI